MPIELAALAQKVVDQKFGFVPLVMPRPRSWPKSGRCGNTVKTPFGLCSWYPSNDPKTILVYPTVKQVESYLRKVLKT